MIAEGLARLRGEKFGVVYADPAWSFKTFNAETAPHRSADEPYKVMSREDLLALPVADVVAKDCVLLMWVIGSHLDQALALGRAWGFEYKTDAFTWVKTGKYDPEKRPISLGFWSRKQVEQCLLFTRGKPKRLDAGIRQLIEADDHTIYAPKREHSRKPDETYSRIERLVAGPYLELFARSNRPGWTALGDEVGKFEYPNCDRNMTGLCDVEALEMIG